MFGVSELKEIPLSSLHITPLGSFSPLGDFLSKALWHEKKSIGVWWVDELASNPGSTVAGLWLWINDQELVVPYRRVPSGST